MIKAGRGEWTDKQILDALHGVNGSIEVAFRFDVLKDGIRDRSVSAEGSVTLNRFADIQRTARFAFDEPLDWLKEEVKPYMLLCMGNPVSEGFEYETWDARDALNYTFDEWDALALTWDMLDNNKEKRWAEFPLGVFILSTPKRSSKNARTSWSVEAYDRTVILQEDSLTEPLLITAGTKYLDAIESVLVSAGITRIVVTEPVNTQIPADRVFEIGTKKLSVVNSLLNEINYNPIYCDADGAFIISPYVAPSAAQVSYTYKADHMSIIGRDTESELDYYNVPNVFIAICSNPDLEQDYVSVWINDNPASKLSTIQRGRRIVSEIYQPDAIASQAALDKYIGRIAFEANQVYKQLIFKTALNPLHERAEVLSLQHPDATGVYVESSWTIPLSADGEMTHHVRRLVVI